jgi:hypothetical protein
MAQAAASSAAVAGPLSSRVSTPRRMAVWTAAAAATASLR